MKRPRVTPHSVQYAAPNERIVEFSNQHGGGLISFRSLTNGTLLVEVYRCDANVTVQLPQNANAFAGATDPENTETLHWRRIDDSRCPRIEATAAGWCYSIYRRFDSENFFALAVHTATVDILTAGGMDLPLAKEEEGKAFCEKLFLADVASRRKRETAP